MRPGVIRPECCCVSVFLDMSAHAAGPLEFRFRKRQKKGHVESPSLGGTAQASYVLSSNEIEVMVPSSLLLVGRCLGRTMEVSS